MITLIVLIALFAIGYCLCTRDDYFILGFSMCSIFGLLLIFHSVSWGLVSYSYDIFVERRNAFEETLKAARESGNEYETAAISKEVAEWNMSLAHAKFSNRTLFLDQYIDDRVESLEPIK